MYELVLLIGHMLLSNFGVFNRAPTHSVMEAKHLLETCMNINLCVFFSFYLK